MRLQRTIVPLLALSLPVAAIHLPSLPSQHPARSTWRKVSNRIISALWRPESTTPQCHNGRPDVDAKLLAQYEGDIVLRFNVSNAEEVDSLKEAVSTLILDVWDFTQDWVDIRLAEPLVPSLLGLLPKSLHNSHKPLLRQRDLALAIWNTYPKSIAKESTTVASPVPQRQFSAKLPTGDGKTTSGDSNIFFSDYQPLSVIVPWMRLLSSLFTTHTRLVKIGTTAEGRDIHALRIGVHPTNRQEETSPRKTILIAAGLHAREWISTSTANYIAYSLITGYGKNAPITQLLEAFDFVIVPTINPDGYVYTWETDRLWRKNRQQTNVRFCQGLDLDHSFGYEWDGDATAGNACSESYAGEQPFQATEAKQLAQWAKNQTENSVEFVSFIDLHSYSQQILYPYGYSCDRTPPGLEDLEELAFGLEKAIRVSHGHQYEVMSACEGNTAWVKDKKKILPFVESPGGSALDYFHHELHTRWSYQIKLRDKGTYGFLLPREHIVPTGKEIFDAMLYLGSFLTEAYGVAKASPVTLAKSVPEGKGLKVDL
ncbi:hypothetical protein AMS68_006169 [Peltaster fructicola]|uniref:Inactive metallocarboxypeptidase ECM14 n=1 Tax=Peltaster fructicola TaxID=286661 RepID=A0A6H0Y0U4_9PEZI|nr:hypothetical protein AMS68_006169 [Peltaster fructicola]